MQVCLLPRVGGLAFILSPALNPQLDPKDELILHKEYRNCGTTQQLPAPLRLSHLCITHLCFIYRKQGGSICQTVSWLSTVNSGNLHPFNTALALFFCIYIVSVSCQSRLNPPLLCYLIKFIRYNL